MSPSPPTAPTGCASRWTSACRCRRAGCRRAGPISRPRWRRWAGLAITKRHWGAFHGTELDLQLRRRGIRSLVIAGIATNFGVEMTAREAWQHGYAVVIAEDACSGSGEGLHAFAIERILPRVARVRRAAEILLV